MRVDQRKIDDDGLHRLMEQPTKADGQASPTQIECVPLAWPWSEYKAELPPSGSSRRRRTNSHPVDVEARRIQLPLLPRKTDWNGIMSVSLAVCAFAALGALELHFRNAPAQAPPALEESKTIPPTIMRGHPAEEKSSPPDAPVEGKDSAPVSSAGPALDGASPVVPRAAKAEPAAPQGGPSKQSFKPSDGRAKHKKRAGKDVHRRMQNQ